MRDIDLWRLLQQPAWPVEEVIELLQQLADRPLQEREPFLGWLPPALRHADPAVRAAALRVFAGATGRSALILLLNALEDSDETVRQTALEAFYASTWASDPSRWIHALFHPSESIRRAALSSPSTFRLSHDHLLYLLDDPACRSLVEQQLDSEQLSGSSVSLLLDFLRRGVVERSFVRRLSQSFQWSDWESFIGEAAQRDTDLSQDLREAADPNWPSTLAMQSRPDRFDEMLELFWQPDEPDSDSSPHQRFFECVWQASLAKERPFQTWVAYSLLVMACKQGTWPTRVAELCAVLFPTFLTFSWVPLTVRREAVAAFYRAGNNCPPFRTISLKAILQNEISTFEQEGEQLVDLYVVGALLHAVKANVYKELCDWVPLPLLSQSFKARQERSVWLLRVPGLNVQQRSELIHALGLLDGPINFELMAELARLVPSDNLDFLTPLDGASSCQLLEYLLPQERLPSGKNALSDNKIRHLAQILARKIADGYQTARFLNTWLAREFPEHSDLCLAILSQIAREAHTSAILSVVVALDQVPLRRFVRALPFCVAFPYNAQIELARLLAGSADPELQAWGNSRLQEHGKLYSPPAVVQPTERLGLCRELEQIADPVSPDIDKCQALLASHDPPGQVLAQLRRFLPADPERLKQLDVLMVNNWRTEANLPFLGHLWLYRWDQHRAALAAALEPDTTVRLPASAGGFVSVIYVGIEIGVKDATESLPFCDRSLSSFLLWATNQPILELGRRAWQAGLSLLKDWRFRQPNRWQATWTDSLNEVILAALQTPLADHVAELVLHGKEHVQQPQAVATMARLRQQLIELLPDLPDSVQQAFSAWIDIRGLPARIRKRIPTAAALPQQSVPVETLRQWLVGDNLEQAGNAARQLLGMGEQGSGILAESLDSHPRTLWPLQVLDELADNADVRLRERLRQLVSDVRADPETRFRVARQLWPDGKEGVHEAALEAACESGPVGWFQQDDYNWLATTQPEGAAIELRLVLSPHPHAYGQAVAKLVARDRTDQQARAALVAFLELGTSRMLLWREMAAGWLYKADEREACLPLLLAKKPDEEGYQQLLVGVAPEVVQAITSGILLAGQGDATEIPLLNRLNVNEDRLSGPRVDVLARQSSLQELMSNGSTPAIRQAARRSLRSGVGRTDKLQRIAETFAWGVRLGRQLTGQVFTLEMIASEELGYTRLKEQKLYITPMPILRGHRNAREIVRGLILHEYGHHLYHKGEVAESIWTQAMCQQLQPLLNLVSDEHLERNLRAQDVGFGNYLKTLAAYAFQHATREVPIDQLLTTLGSRAFSVLSKSVLRVARQSGHVGIDNGRVLLQMEKEGMSFARFMRALRMGLGNRHGDEKVARALELFRGNFRQSDMPRLLEIAKELRDIFGDEAQILDTFDQSQMVLCSGEELEDAREGITNEELQEAIRRAMESTKAGNPNTKPQGTGGRGYNTNPDLNFNLITNIVPMPYDPERYADYARQISRPAGQMRRVLQQLGLGMVPQRHRLQGRSLDRARLRALVLRGEPRVLIARQVKFTTDLFLGVLIDCSGSMANSDNIEKAKLFGALLAEASRGLPGVDLRLWGFTDETIYDCGNAHRPAVHDLAAGGGNNDAAALWHAACVARASQRKAKLLVMISDGSPTECSVEALKALVTRLTTRWHMLCAQVAVRELDDICFPHHVLLEEDNIAEAVKRFGIIMVNLVRRALRG